MKKSIILIGLILVGSMSMLYAQNYQGGIGLRVGPSIGPTYKHFISPENAVEVIGANRWGGWNITTLFEHHQRLMKNRRGGTGGFDSQRLHYFLGVGGHVGNWKANGVNPWYAGNGGAKYLVIGADAIIGLEYAMQSIPFCFSIDYKPGINFAGLEGNNGFLWLDEVGFTGRFIF